MGRDVESVDSPFFFHVQSVSVVSHQEVARIVNNEINDASIRPVRIINRHILDERLINRIVF